MQPSRAEAGAAADSRREELIAQARELRAILLADPHRTRYHFVTLEGDCRPFDPNGAIFWEGKYHLLRGPKNSLACSFHSRNIALGRPADTLLTRESKSHPYFTSFKNIPATRSVSIFGVLVK